MKKRRFPAISCACALAACAPLLSCQRPEITHADTASQLLLQLGWLARDQQADGAWGHPTSPPAVRTRLTGLALISFLAADYTHLSKDVMDGFSVGDVMRRGLQYLMAIQNDKGCLMPADSDLEAHLWGTLVFTEYFCFSFAAYKACAERAAAYVFSLQRPDGGWGTGETPDPMTTLLALLVVESARYHGLEVPDATIRGANDALASLAERDAKKAFDPVTTAALLTVVSLWQTDREAWYRPFAATWAARTALALDRATASDVHLVHWGSMALAHYDGPYHHGRWEERPAGKRWDGWNGKLKALLRDSQRTDAHDELRGSWNPSKPGGLEPAAPDDARVEATCLNGLCLCLFFRWGPSPDLKHKSCRRIWLHSHEPW